MGAKPYRIGLDARAISHPQPGGFKTYTDNIVRHLPSGNGQNSYLIYLDRALRDPLFSTAREDLALKVLSAEVPLVGVALREQLTLPAQLLRDQVDLAHFPYATAPLWSPCPFVITIHDTIELMPGRIRRKRASTRRQLMHLYNRVTQMLAVRRAAAVVTVSQHSKSDIVQMLRVPAEKIFVTYEAPGVWFRQVDASETGAAFRQQYGLEAEFILGIGSADPRKNLESLVRAYSQLPSELIARYQLVIVWTHPQLQGDVLTLVSALGLSNRVIFLKKVTNQDLVRLYNAATLFVFPSRYEGFGLPPLEAMACGTAVIAANNSSIPEIVEQAALLTGAEDIPQMTGLITEVLTNAALRLKLSDAGLKRAAQFSWEKCARETVDVYHTVLAARADSLNFQT